MLDGYHDDVFVYDPVFQNLDSPQVRAMWEMLVSRAKGMELSFSNVSGDEGNGGDARNRSDARNSDGYSYGSCDWTAVYTFSATGRKVVNIVKAHFTFKDGKIIEHHDDFNLWRWSAQALGLPGQLFGWTSLLQNSIRKKARVSLEKFMGSKVPASH
jgi:hypothetical protein